MNRKFSGWTEWDRDELEKAPLLPPKITTTLRYKKIRKHDEPYTRSIDSITLPPRRIYETEVERKSNHWRNHKYPVRWYVVDREVDGPVTT